MRFAIPLFLATLCAACGGDDGQPVQPDAAPGPDTSPITVAEAQSGCHSQCEHDVGCDPGSDTVEACTAGCVAGVSDWMRTDAFEATVSCITALSCNTSNQTCVTSCQPTPTHDAYEAQCRAVFAGCGSADQISAACETTPRVGADDGMFCYVTPSIVEEMTACIPTGTGCNAGATCIRNVLDAHHVPF